MRRVLYAPILSANSLKFLAATTVPKTSNNSALTWRQEWCLALLPWPAQRVGLYAALEERGDRLDLIARIERQAGAQRIPRVERTLAGKHLGRNKVPQNRNLGIFLALGQDVGLDGERHEYSCNGLARIGRVLLGDCH